MKWKKFSEITKRLIEVRKREIVHGRLNLCYFLVDFLVPLLNAMRFSLNGVRIRQMLLIERL